MAGNDPSRQYVGGKKKWFQSHKYFRRYTGNLEKCGMLGHFGTILMKAPAISSYFRGIFGRECCIFWKKNHTAIDVSLDAAVTIIAGLIFHCFLFKLWPKTSLEILLRMDHRYRRFFLRFFDYTRHTWCECVIHSSRWRSCVCSLFHSWRIPSPNGEKQMFARRSSQFVELSLSWGKSQLVCLSVCMSARLIFSNNLPWSIYEVDAADIRATYWTLKDLIY